MKTLRIAVSLGFAVAACACIAIGVARGLRGSAVEPRKADATDVPQCGHWCVMRCCELLGAPLDMADVMQILPRRDEGHSLLQIAEALEMVGLKAEGRKESLASLAASAQFPVLIHLHSPDHFVVVAGVDGERVHLFDGRGRRRSVQRPALAERWSGKMLRVTRGTPSVALPAFLPRRDGAPRVQFDHLFLDRGDVPAVGEPVSFDYRFVNLGDRELVIEGVHPTCPCIETDFPKSPVLPAAEGFIKLVYQSRDARGPFVHETTVETNDPLVPFVVLKAAGYADTGVIVSPVELTLGEIVAGERAVTACFVGRAADNKKFTIERVECDLDGATVRYYAVVDPTADGGWSLGGRRLVRAPEDTQVVELAWVPKGPTDRLAKGRLIVYTDVERFERITIPVTARVVAPIGLFPSVLNFGEVAAGGNVEQTVKVASRGGTAFRVVGIRPETPGIESSFTTPSAGNHAELRFIADSDAAVAAAGTSFVVDVELQGGKTLSLPLPTAAWPRRPVDTIGP